MMNRKMHDDTHKEIGCSFDICEDFLRFKEISLSMLLYTNFISVTPPAIQDFTNVMGLILHDLTSPLPI